MNAEYHLKLIAALEDVDARLKRLEAPQGLERSLVAQAAERAERQGGEEDSREGKRVAPVKAQAALRELVGYLQADVADALQGAAVRRWIPGFSFSVALLEAKAALLRSWVDAVNSLLPEPESEADAPASTPTGETSTEANP